MSAKAVASGKNNGNGRRAKSIVVASPRMLSAVRMWLACTVVVALILASAIGVIFSTYKSRQLFSDVQLQYKESRLLEEQWGRLLLEQSTWASHSRVERLARSKLSMVAPGPAEMIVIRQ